MDYNNIVSELIYFFCFLCNNSNKIENLTKTLNKVQMPQRGNWNFGGQNEKI